MSRMPAITFEILRGGPAHNQLLSPITEYLALCGDAAPHTLRLPFEHRDLIDRVRRLRYEPAKDREQDRRYELDRLGRDVGATLGSVPSFAAELSGLRGGRDEPIHVRLVLNGNELGLVPWEMAHIPNGLAGAGMHLLLHPGAPLSLTREVRGASRRRFRWNREPKVLFVCTTPADFPANTIEAHLLALMRALEPWSYSRWLENGWRVECPLHVVQEASIAEIRDAIAHDPTFTHVHFLAHGAPLSSDSDARFGLLLHRSQASTKREVVSGEQLAQALRTCGESSCRSDPTMVTLATCDSANQASVVTPGGSVAHELHQHGIPWVIASQLPLTVAGSVILVDDLYGRLLRGDDPREALQCVRSHLAARFQDRHDWATLVSYASFPPSFDADVAEFDRRAAIAQRDRAYVLGDLLVLDRLLSELGRRQREGSKLAAVIRRKRAQKEIPNPDQAREAIELAERAFDRAVAAIRAGEERTTRADDHARHAAMVKRLAEQKWMHPRPGDDWRAELRRSRELYVEGSTRGNTLDHWAIGQRLVLDEVLGTAGSDPDAEHLSLQLAVHAARLGSKSVDAQARMWANSTLADLTMVAIARGERLPGAESPPSPDDVVGALRSMVQEGDRAVWTTLRQFWRYLFWWDDRDSGPKWRTAAERGFEFLLDQIEKQLSSRDAP